MHRLSILACSIFVVTSCGDVADTGDIALYEGAGVKESPLFSSSTVFCPPEVHGLVSLVNLPSGFNMLSSSTQPYLTESEPFSYTHTTVVARDVAPSKNLRCEDTQWSSWSLSPQRQPVLSNGPGWAWDYWRPYSEFCFRTSGDTQLIRCNDTNPISWYDAPEVIQSVSYPGWNHTDYSVGWFFKPVQTTPIDQFVWERFVAVAEIGGGSVGARGSKLYRSGAFLGYPDRFFDQETYFSTAESICEDSCSYCGGNGACFAQCFGPCTAQLQSHWSAP